MTGGGFNYKKETQRKRSNKTLISLLSQPAFLGSCLLLSWMETRARNLNELQCLKIVLTHYNQFYYFSLTCISLY